MAQRCCSTSRMPQASRETSATGGMHTRHQGRGRGGAASPSMLPSCFWRGRPRSHRLAHTARAISRATRKGGGHIRSRSPHCGPPALAPLPGHCTSPPCAGRSEQRAPSPDKPQTRAHSKCVGRCSQPRRMVCAAAPCVGAPTSATSPWGVGAPGEGGAGREVGVAHDEAEGQTTQPQRRRQTDRRGELRRNRRTGGERRKHKRRRRARTSRTRSPRTPPHHHTRCAMGLLLACCRGHGAEGERL